MNFNIKKIVLSCAIVASAAVAGVGASNVFAESDVTVTGGEPDSWTQVTVNSPDNVLEKSGGDVKISSIEVDLSSLPAGVTVDDLKDSKFSVTVGAEPVVGQAYSIDISTSLKLANGKSLFEKKYGGSYVVTEADVTLNVKDWFKAGTSVVIKHLGTDEEWHETVDDDENVSFTVEKGFSTFTVSAETSSSSSSESKSSSVSYDSRDKNHDGVVTCDEAYGEGWTWDENQKACVVSVSASPASVPAANRNAVPKTGVKD